MIKHLFLVLLIFRISISQSQEKTISGTVTEQSGPLPGVSVVIKGTTNGTETDFDGKYSIKVQLGDVLVFNYLGYKKVEKLIGINNIINVKMTADSNQLDEIVVVAYGTSTKYSFAGSALISKSSKYNKNHSKIINQLSVKNNGNLFSNDIKNTFSSKLSKSPLYIVDGVAINQNYNSIIKNIDKKEIEKINVYKPNRAKKYFGYYARNGCIVITTHKGNYRLENDESYAQFKENKFKRVILNRLSTFSIDVDKASYSNVRRMINNGDKIPLGAVKIEEMINYFNYNYSQPKGKKPFSINTNVVKTPWNSKTKLVRIGLQGKKYKQKELPASNLTFLIDVSGSMGSKNKLPLLKSAFKLLVNQLRKKDRVSIVVYAGAAGVVLEPTSGNNKEKIIAALDKLESGGSTAGGRGIELAYKIAKENYIKNGNNRVILATDGDFNVGETSNSSMEKLIEVKRKSGVFLSVLGFGYGNYKDDKLELLADKGNGNHAYIDTMQEAQKVFGKEFGGTIHTIAKDVKIQVEFNPNKVKAYRLIGYENRMLNAEDFIDDTKDAGEIGSGHTVTALYEIIPIGVKSSYLKKVNKLKYKSTFSNLNKSDELFTVKFRYKEPAGEKSKEIIHVQKDELDAINSDVKFASAVALFGMHLKKSKFTNNFSIEKIVKLAEEGRGEDEFGYRSEFIRLVKSYNLSI